MTYYERELQPDGSFATEEDRANEAQVAEQIEATWADVTVHSFGRWAPVDWWLERNGGVWAVAEMKSRNHASNRWPTVFLNLRKWLELSMYAIQFKRPAYFIVQFTDSTKYIDVRAVGDALAIGGCTRIVKGRSDIEPVIHVRVSRMQELTKERHD